DDIAQLKQQLAQTQALVKQLQTRLEAVEAKNATAPRPSANKTEATIKSQPEPAPLESASAAPGAGNAFNPAISAVLMGGFNAYTRNPETAKIAGFAQGDEAGLPNRGFSLGESELTFSSNVDD